MKEKKYLSTIKNSKVIYYCLIGLILAVYFLQAFSLAHQLPSRVDEGSFLTKGYFFISGKYKPFEDYGPWTNNMPLAYLIPGIPQVLFGPGLKVGRYFAIFTAFLTLIGLWVLTKRLVGKWWSILPMLAFVLSPAWIATNVQAVSQVLVACQVTWMLVFLLGEDRAGWQIGIAALLSTSTTLTRQNMVFLMAFVVLYTWWQFGFKKALIAFVCAAIPFVAVHLIYYPKIMNLWYTWLPAAIKRKFAIGNIAGGGKQVWLPDGDLIDRISSFFITTRYYFFPFLGCIIAIPLALKQNNWRTKHEWKMIVSLIIIFFLLFILHGWASLTKNYCIFCFSNYVAFFIPIAMVITPFALAAITRNSQKFTTALTMIFLLVLVPGIFFGSVNSVGRTILSIPVPRFKAGGFVGGTTELWEIIRNRFGFTYDFILLRIPPVFGLLCFLIFIIAIYILTKLPFANKKYRGANFFLYSFFVLAILLTPTNLLGGFLIENECDGDVITAYETAGAQLNAQIPDETNVYWGSGSVVTPLLYIADKGIQPLQLNGIYPKRDGGDRDILEKNGYFNRESVRDWRDNADYILVQYFNMGDFWRDYLDPELFDELMPTEPIDPCVPQSSIKVFRRKHQE